MNETFDSIIESMEQAGQLVRVSERISHAIYQFWRDKIKSDEPEFTMKELTTYVNIRHQIAPDSAGRILRDMRKRGNLNYELVSRSQSRYRAIARI